jgi:hypothetical protein
MSYCTPDNLIDLPPINAPVLMDGAKTLTDGVNSPTWWIFEGLDGSIYWRITIGPANS